MPSAAWTSPTSADSPSAGALAGRRILVINPANDPPSSRAILIEPIDALLVATALQEAGAAVAFVDMDVRQLSAGDVAAAAEAHGADAALFIADYHIPLHADAAFGCVRRAADALAALGIPSVVGGKIATYHPDRLREFPRGTVFAKGELERAAAEILARGPRKQVPGAAFLDDRGALVETPAAPVPVDLAALPVPDRSLVRLEDYIDVRTMLTSRGCNLACGFCHVPGFWGKWRARPPEDVVGEIQMLRARHGARKILFLDDNATAGRRRLFEICARLEALRADPAFDVALGCLGTVVSFDAKLAAAMAGAGFRWIHFGAESGDDALLDAVGKRTTKDGILQAVKTAQAAGLRVRTSWILDLPGTTPEALERTADAVLGAGSEEIRLHHLAIRDGSLYRDAFEGEATQYIHHGRPETRTGVDPEALARVTTRLVAALEDRGYATVRDADEFCDLAALRRRSPDLRIVSLCPLRYGLGW